MSAPTIEQLVADPTLLHQAPGPVPQPLTGGPAPVPVPAYGDHVAEAVGAAVLVTVLLVRHKLQATAVPEPGSTRLTASAVWDEVAPTWMRLAVPAVQEAFRLGRVSGVTPGELEHLATDYAGGLGRYLDESCADALVTAMDAQLAGRWSADLAWHRAAYAYGLDRQQMRQYLRACVGTAERPSGSPIPLVARTLVDKGLLLRAERVGRDQSYSATETGKALAWIYMVNTGRLSRFTDKEWQLGQAEHHCTVCRLLSDQVVPVSDWFQLPGDGPKFLAPRAHPGCTCKVRLRQVGPVVKVAGSLPRPGSAKTLRPKWTGQPTVAGVALVAQDTGRVLMLQRAVDRTDPASGCWEFPGGHLERGEAPLDGAVREWQEEVRRTFPGAAPVSSWRHGIYQGFVSVVEHEDAVPTHTRGRVHNPDDPDNDQVEAYAWWDPAHLAGNRAVRPEIRAALRDVRKAIRAVSSDTARIGKAFDPKEKRDPGGRWARSAFADPVQPVLPPVEEEEKTTSPFQRASSPFAASPFASSPFAPAAFTRGETEQSSPFGHTGAKPFAAARQRHHEQQTNIILLPKKAKDTEEATPGRGRFYLPTRDYNVIHGHPPNWQWDHHTGSVQFTAKDDLRAEQRLNPWGLLGDSDYVLPYSGNYVDIDGARAAWAPVETQAKRLKALALADPGPVIKRLDSQDLDRIWKMADWPYPKHNDKSMREEIQHKVERYANAEPIGDDSLVGAFLDYTIYRDPERYFGRTTGHAMSDALTNLDLAGISIEDGDHPVPAQQVFSIEQKHPETYFDGETMMLRGRHAIGSHRYRSALLDYDDVPVPVMRIGMRETMLHPFEPGRQS